MCERKCIGNCKDSICNRVTGKCDGKCAAGWNGSLCLEGHSPLFYHVYFGTYCFKNSKYLCKFRMTLHVSCETIFDTLS